MYNDFHAHLVWTNLKIQESNMHGKLKVLYPYINTQESYMLSKSSDFLPMKSVKDMDVLTNYVEMVNLLCIQFELRI